MNVKEIKDFDIVCQSGISKSHIESTKGVLLTEIVEKAKLHRRITQTGISTLLQELQMITKLPFHGQNCSITLLEIKCM